jgi:hypothetical protein
VMAMRELNISAEPKRRGSVRGALGIGRNLRAALFQVGVDSEHQRRSRTRIRAGALHRQKNKRAR